MSLLNLNIGEFIALFSTITGVLVTLYLLDRSRRRQVVATLRFWKPAEAPTEMKQKRRIQQPWSLILQVLSIALLLLAIAQLQLGGNRLRAHDHVLVLDTSAWMNARTAKGTLMDDARASALAWLKSVPASDRVMVVRADALATPATPMELNRTVIERAIRDSVPSAAALNLEQAFGFAQRVQRMGTSPGGEIVFAGAGRIANAETADVTAPANLRVLPVASPAGNAGITKIGLQQSPSDPGSWQVFVSVKNYGTELKVIPLAVQFGGAAAGSRTLTLKSGAEVESTFALHTRARGLLEARLLSQDAFPDDDRAALEVPAQRSMRVIVYTDEPDLLRPILASHSAIAAVFRAPSQYRADGVADAIILDRFAPPEPPNFPAIWIDPPEAKSPVRVKTIDENVKLARWNSDTELGTGLRTKDLQLESAEVFSAAPDDIRVAEVEHGPVIVARPQTSGSQKLVAIGFHPVRSAMKYELATPLLFANVLRWIDPDVFRSEELNGRSVGVVEAKLDRGVDAESVVVSSDGNRPVPFTVDGDRLRMFAGTPGNVTVKEGNRQMVYSLTLPDPGDTLWNIPAHVRRGISRSMIRQIPATDLWPWLALAGGIGLLVEWILFGRARSAARVKAAARRRERVLQKKAS